MPVLELLRDTYTGSPDGVIVPGADAAVLLRKLSARLAHYAELQVARGVDWLACFSTRESEVALPWCGGASVYLKRLSEGCYCQTGYRPNTPPDLNTRLGAYIAASHSITGPVALVSGTPVRVFELGGSRRLGTLDPAVLHP